MNMQTNALHPSPSALWSQSSDPDRLRCPLLIPIKTKRMTYAVISHAPYTLWHAPITKKNVQAPPHPSSFTLKHSPKNAGMHTRHAHSSSCQLPPRICSGWQNLAQVAQSAPSLVCSIRCNLRPHDATVGGLLLHDACVHGMCHGCSLSLLVRGSQLSGPLLRRLGLLHRLLSRGSVCHCRQNLGCGQNRTPSRRRQCSVDEDGSRYILAGCRDQPRRHSLRSTSGRTVSAPSHSWEFLITEK